MPLVDRVMTSLSETDLVSTIVGGYWVAFARIPSPQTVGVAWAHLALEHRRGQAIWCHNFGNITCDPKDSHTDYYEHLQIEYTRDDPPKEITVSEYFEANPNALNGSQRYWEYMAHRFPDVLADFSKGWPSIAAQDLGRGRYFTGNVDAYRKFMGWLYGYFQRNLLQEVLPAENECQAKSLATDEDFQLYTDESISNNGLVNPLP